MFSSRYRFSYVGLFLVVALSSPYAYAADLMSVYELARQSDPQLKNADAMQRVNAEGVIQARSRLLPNVSATGTLNDSNGQSSFVDTIPQDDGTVRFGPSRGESDTRSRDYRISLRQTIYNHANYAQLAASRSQRSRGEADYQSAVDALFIRVAEAYFAVLTAKSNVEAALAEQKAVEQQLEQANQRFEVGLTAITDVHEARARADASRAGAILAQNQLDDATEALTELTGEKIDHIAALRQEIPLELPDPASPEAWVNVALEQNPVLAAKQFSLQAALHQVESAKAAHYPYLDANVGYSDFGQWGSRSSGSFSFPARQTQEGASVSLVLTVPLFEGFSTQSRVRQAIFQRDASDSQVEAERRSVLRQTRSAYRSVQVGMSEIKARQLALVSAESALQATQAGFEVGTRTIVDVLLSQQLFYAAQREYARARHQFIVAGLRLKQSAGVIEVSDIQAVNDLLEDAGVGADP
jgi:outer membrane protein